MKALDCGADLLRSDALEGLVKVCEMELRRSPTPTRQTNLAIAVLRGGQYRRAENLFDELLNARPADTDALFGRGLAKLLEADHGAQADIQRAVKIDNGVRARYERMGYRLKQETPNTTMLYVPERVGPVASFYSTANPK